MKSILAALTLCGASLTFAGSGMFGTKSSPMPSVGNQESMGVFPVLQMLVALAIVLAMVKWLMPLAIKKFGKKLSSNTSGGIRIDETATVGSMNMCVVTVRGKTLLIGSTADSVTCLADLTEATQSQPATFHDILGQQAYAPAIPRDPDPLEDIAGQLERLKKLGL
ncbi:MAG TPA: flagellar biosynthetic protein FliO [Fimbriimonas sp.]|nr:flagellar biosynthetic protein FliO [Fimbriimonas sp.]